MWLGFWGWGPFITGAAGGRAGPGSGVHLGHWREVVQEARSHASQEPRERSGWSFGRPQPRGQRLGRHRRGGCVRRSQRVRRAEGEPRSQEASSPRARPLPLRVPGRSFQRALSSSPRHWTLSQQRVRHPAAPRELPRARGPSPPAHLAEEIKPESPGSVSNLGAGRGVSDRRDGDRDLFTCEQRPPASTANPSSPPLHLSGRQQG